MNNISKSRKVFYLIILLGLAFYSYEYFYLPKPTNYEECRDRFFSKDRSDSLVVCEFNHEKFAASGSF